MRSLLKQISLFSLFFVTSITSLQNANAIETYAKQAVLMDFATGELLYEKNADERMGPSSMTKIMTAYVAFNGLRNKDFDLETKFLVSRNAWKTGGSRTYIELDSQVALSDLLQGIIVQSGNDACVAVAEGYSGSIETFAKEMNQTAKDLGLKNTNFTNPHGLTDENHYSSARDLALIGRAIIEDFPEYYHYFGQKEFTYNGIKQQNRNSLLNNEALGVDGLKTGHTDAAGYGIVASAAKSDLRLIAVVNGLNSAKSRIEEVQKLLAYGFATYKNTKLYSNGEVISVLKVWNGESDKIAAITHENIEILVPRRKNARSAYSLKIQHNEPIYAPIKKGDKIAELLIFKNDELVREIPLFAEKEIAEANFLKMLKDKIKLLLGNKLKV